MAVSRKQLATDGSGDGSFTISSTGHLLYGWFIDVGSLANTADITVTDETGRTLDSATNVAADGIYLPREADAGGDSQTDYPPILGNLTFTVAQGGTTVTDCYVTVWTIN